MATTRVRVRSLYTYRPVGWDIWDRPYGEQAGILKPGDTVRVVNLNGCPPANTMGMAHIQTREGVFAGLVLCNSLVKV
jgi:hypothetical protein